jgi:hypothetical protein
MAQACATVCSICKEDHALLDQPMPHGDVCVCDRCLETVARENFIWICLYCRTVYLESKELFIERESDPEAQRMFRGLISECVIQGIETCLQCGAEKKYRSPHPEAELIRC